jgi:hypothetical protein
VIGSLSLSSLRNLGVSLHNFSGLGCSSRPAFAGWLTDRLDLQAPFSPPQDETAGWLVLVPDHQRYIHSRPPTGAAPHTLALRSQSRAPPGQHWLPRLGMIGCGVQAAGGRLTLCTLAEKPPLRSLAQCWAALIGPGGPHVYGEPNGAEELDWTPAVAAHGGEGGPRAKRRDAHGCGMWGSLYMQDPFSLRRSRWHDDKCHGK